jgi:hypothetical protein
MELNVGAFRTPQTQKNSRCIAVMFPDFSNHLICCYLFKVTFFPRESHAMHVQQVLLNEFPSLMAIHTQQISGLLLIVSLSQCLLIPTLKQIAL